MGNSRSLVLNLGINKLKNHKRIQTIYNLRISKLKLKKKYKVYGFFIASTGFILKDTTCYVLHKIRRVGTPRVAAL